jgi:hypothetical protein
MIKETDTWRTVYDECAQTVAITEKQKKFRIVIESATPDSEIIGDVIALMRAIKIPEGKEFHYRMRSGQRMSAAFGAWLQNEILRKG